MRKISNNKKIVIIIIVILLIIIYWFYKKENKYLEVEEISDLNEFEIDKEVETSQSEKVQEEKSIIVVHITGEVKKRRSI